MKTDTRKNIGIRLSLDATFLWKAAEGVVQYAKEHTDWRLFGNGLGITEPLDPRRKLDGVIFNKSRDDLDPSRLHGKTVCVKVGTEFKPWKSLMVFQDHWAIGRAGAEHLIELGLPRLFFCGDPEKSFSVYREEGFREAAEKAGVPAESVGYPLVYNPTSAVWRRNIGRLAAWLRTLPVPCGVVACNDFCAAQITVAAESIGRAIPDELALVGVNNDSVTCSLTTPHLSSVDFDGFDLGYRAAELLDAVLESRPHTTPVILPPGKLVVRDSTNYIPIEDPMIRRAMMKIQKEGTSRALRVGDLLADLPVSRRVFERRFRQTVGRSPKEEILRVRLDHAKSRLREPGPRITRICEEMGFTSLPEFSRFIRNATGRSPSGYRKKHLRK